MPPSPKTAHPLATNSGWVPPFDACQKWMLCGDCPVQPFRTCRFVRDRLLRFLAVFLTGGTEGSNPSPSTGESHANLTSSIRAPKISCRDAMLYARRRAEEAF